MFCFRGILFDASQGMVCLSRVESGKDPFQRQPAFSKRGRINLIQQVKEINETHLTCHGRLGPTLQHEIYPFNRVCEYHCGPEYRCTLKTGEVVSLTTW